METTWEKDYHDMKESQGLLSPHVINQQEKTTWERDYNESVVKPQLQQKLKNNEPINYGDMGWGKVILEGLKNTPEGLYNYVTSIAEIVKHPVLTAKGIGAIASGTLKLGAARMYQAGLGAENLNIDPKENPDMAAVLKIEEDMYKTFGTEAGFKEYIAKNPIDALANLASILIPIAKTLEISGKLPKTAMVLEKIATATEPINLGGKIIKAPFSMLMNLPKVRQIPEGLYGRALNLGKWINDAQANKLINFGMKAGVPVRFKELEKLNEHAKKLNKLITNLISDLDPDIYKVHRAELLKGLDEFAKEKGLGMRGMQDVEIIKRRIQSVIEGEEKFRGSDYLTPLEVQKKKIAGNKELNKEFQDVLQKTLDTTVDNETVMMLTKNMRNAIETMIPEVKLTDIPKKINNKIVQKYWPGTRELSAKELNDLEGSIINLRNAIGQEARKKKFGDIFSFQVGQKMATAGVAGTIVSKSLNLGAAAEMVSYGAMATGIAIGVIDSSPSLKSKLAMYLRNLRRFGIDTKPTGAMIRLGLYETVKPERELIQSH